MNINRHNYEEFFLLYADNELTPAQRSAVELFVQQNPDLKTELQLLQQTVFKADDIVFANKAALLKDEITPLQQQLLLYVDDELNNADKKAVQQLLLTDAAAQKEFTLLQKTQLQPDAAVVFADKASLYRNEGKVIRFPWLRVAAAAILLGFGTWTVISVIQKPLPKTIDTAVNKTDGTNNNLPAVKDTITQNNFTTQAILPAPKATQVNTITTPAVTPVVNTVAARNNKSTVKTTVQKINTLNKVLKDNIVEPVVVDNKKPSNNLPKPDYNNFNNNSSNKTETANVPPTEAVVANSTSGKTETATPATNTNAADITTYAINTGNNGDDAETANNNKVLYMQEDNVKRSKLGGFFRKVKRMVERTTNVKTGNGVKIAGFDIAIK
jgi:hypothetical protein